MRLEAGSAPYHGRVNLFDTSEQSAVRPTDPPQRERPGGRAVAFVVLGIGVLLAWWMGVSMAAYVHRVTPANPLVLAGSALIVVAVAFAATLPSARRAAATQPARVLRS